MDAATIQLRPVSATDEPFLLALYSSTRTEELNLWGWDDAQRQVFLELQFRAQRLSYQTQFPDAEHQLIEQDNHPIGSILVHRGATAIRLVSIALLPPYRQQGVGTWLLQNLLSEATKTQRCVKLHVASHNRAQRLYQRLGFQPVQDTGSYLAMEWHGGVLVSQDGGAR